MISVRKYSPSQKVNIINPEFKEEVQHKYLLAAKEVVKFSKNRSMSCYLA